MELTLPPYPIAGVDYGSKLAGTTVLALLSPAGEIQFFCSERKKDADFFLKKLLLQSRPERVFIDAPLSLPGVYGQLPGCKDFFYRKADRELQAMSPMFLGGLTARAMQLRNNMLPENILFLETYPAGWVRFLGAGLQEYRKEKQPSVDFLSKIVDNSPVFIRPSDCASWHHVDALIALLSGLRYENQQHRIFGMAAEGEVLI